tara:strand:+ start:1386 stop:2132 length:747 start_codon:yes stop_codon:yes gene_type:complete
MIFYRNNIQFRQVSSQVQCQFFNSKSFILKEMTDQSYVFSDTARDVMLHLYKVWTTVLMDFEEYFVKEDESCLDERMVDYCSGQIKSKLVCLEKHLKENPSHYDPKFVEPFLTISANIHHQLVCKFGKAFVGQKIILAYKDLGLLAINHLNHLLFAIHELDNLVYNKPKQPFIYIDTVDVRAFLELQMAYPLERLRVYEQHQLFGTKNITLRVGINKETLACDDELADGYHRLYNQVECEGYTIVCAL